MHEILKKEPKPAKLSDVQKAIDSASRADLIRYLGVVARLYVNLLDPGDIARNSTAQRLADDLTRNPQHATGFAVQFLKRHSEAIAHAGGFSNAEAAVAIQNHNIFKE